MAITIDPNVETPPSTVRVFKVLFNNGVTKKDDEGNVEWETPPYTEIILMRCNPMLDDEGHQMLNSFGLPAYEDSGWAASLKISDPAKLTSYLQNIWGPVMIASYSEATLAAADIQWRKIR
jgi:hypothetical protein